MQPANNQNRLFLVQFHLLSGRGEGRVEPSLERGHGLEYTGQKEIQQRPKFRQFVLQRRPGEEEPMWRRVVRVEIHGELAVVIFHAVALVDDHVLPVDFAEDRLVLHDVLVGGEEDVHLVGFDLRGKLLPHHGSAAVGAHDHGGGPFVEFQLPVGQRGEGHDDEKGAGISLGLHQIGHQADRLSMERKTNIIGLTLVAQHVNKDNFKFDFPEKFTKKFTKKIKNRKIDSKIGANCKNPNLGNFAALFCREECSDVL